MTSQKKLGYFSLALLNLSAIISLRHLPIMATYGGVSLLFYLVGAVTFLIPIGLICAELATTWPERGGLYNWIYQAMGKRAAFLVVWWSWLAAITTIMSNLTFLSVTIGLALAPEYLQNPKFITGISIIVIWLMTLMNIFGMRLSALISSVGLVTGTIIPVTLVALFAGYWVLTGREISPQALNFNPSTVVKGLGSLVFYSNVVLSFSGIELAAFHAADAENPQRDYSKAIFLSVGMIISIYLIATLSLAVVLPENDIHLIGGLVQFFQIFFAKFGLVEMGLFLSLILIIGSISGINTWIISPAKGIFAAAEHFHMPQWFSKLNDHGVPVNVLILQAIICSLLVGVLSFSDSIESYFILFANLTTQYSIMYYILMIIAVRLLRVKQPSIHRPFKISNKIFPLVTIGTIIALIAVLILTFIPPEGIIINNIYKYEFFFFCGIVLFSLPVFFFKKIKEIPKDSN